MWQSLQAASNPVPQPILYQPFGQTGAKAGTQFIPFGISGTLLENKINCMVIDPEGRIIVAGYSSDGTNSRFALARFLPTGQLDATFGQADAKAGTQFIPFSIEGTGTDDRAQGIAIDSEGRIIVGGYSSSSGGTNLRFAVARFLPNGQLDTTFGQVGTAKAGTQYVSFNSSGTGKDDKGLGVALDSQGRIFIGGYNYNQVSNVYFFSVACFLPTGQLDTIFGQTGTAQAGTQYIPFEIAGTTPTNNVAYAIAVDSIDNIILGGSSFNNGANSRYAVARFLPTGQLDTTFGQTGTAQAGTQYIPFAITGTGTDRANALMLDPQGNIVLAGSSFTGAATQFSVARFLPTGQLDTTFGQTGTARAGTQYINFSIAGTGTTDQATGIAVDPQGHLLVGGSSNDGGTNRFAVARFLSTGQLDPTFGQTGTVKAGTQYIPFSIAGTSNLAYALACDYQNSIFLAGFGDGGSSRFALAKFITNNALADYQAQYPTEGGFY